MREQPLGKLSSALVVIAVLLAFALGTAGAVVPTRHTFQGSNGVMISYVHFGSSQTNPTDTVVIFPGMSMNASAFEPLAQAASADGSEVFVLEPRCAHKYLPNVLHPSLNPGGTMRDILDVDYRDLLQEVASHAQTTRIHWIGHSFGGIAALAYVTSLRPTISPSMIPVSLTLFGSCDSVDCLREYNRILVNSVASLLVALGTGIHLVPVNFVWPVVDGWGSMPVELSQELTTGEELANQVGDPYIVTDDLDVPTFVLIGAIDEFVRPPQVEEFYDRMPTDKQFMLVPLADHFMTLREMLPLTWPAVRAFQNDH